MRLFGYYRSSSSYRIRIVLNLKGLPWDYVAVKLTDGEQKRPDYLERNPSGLVPVLETGEAALAQSSAIAEFLEEEHPQPALLPAVHVDRARVREMMAVIGCDTQPLQNLRVLNWLRDELSADEEQVKAWIHRWIRGGFEALEQLVERAGSDGRFCYGDAPTLADAWLVPQCYNARRFGVDLADFPLLRAIDAHCLTLPPFADAEPERQPDAPG